MTCSPAAPSLPSTSLDPADRAGWDALRAQGHRMLDDMVDHLMTLRERPVWQPAPASARAAFHQPVPRAPTPLAQAHATFMTQVLPYGVGNTHPGFMGWVHGGGTAEGMLAELLAAGLNANLGGRDHLPIEVERQITRWLRTLFGLPATASGLFVTGSSMANLIGVLLARTRALGEASREIGVGAARLVAYTSAGAHGCVAQAMAISGLGTAALRRVPVDAESRIDLAALRRRLAEDRAAGFTPFLLVGTAGTVDVGAIDDLAALAALARAERLWFHVDGAFGALGVLAPEIAPRLAGLAQADSVALDFHKWGQVPYDAGFILVRDQADALAAFASPAAYLARHPRGLAAGSPWPCDLGPDLSRGFRALKTWFTLVVHGTDRLGAAIGGACALAQRLRARVEAEPALELMAPVPLNIVCFRHRGDATTADPQALDHLNAEIVADLHEAGLAAPSTTRLAGRTVIRAALVNHRTEARDVDALVDAVLACGVARLAR